MTKPEHKNDWKGWINYTELRRKELCAEALGITEWSLPKVHHEYLCNFFLSSISLHQSGEESFFKHREAMREGLGKDLHVAFSLAFDQRLTTKQQENYLKTLGSIVANFGKNKNRPKIKNLQVLTLLLEYLAKEQWPTNKELVHRSENTSFKVSKKNVSSFADEEGIKLPEDNKGRPKSK